MHFVKQKSCCFIKLWYQCVEALNFIIGSFTQHAAFTRIRMVDAAMPAFLLAQHAAFKRIRMVDAATLAFLLAQSNNIAARSEMFAVPCQSILFFHSIFLKFPLDLSILEFSLTLCCCSMISSSHCKEKLLSSSQTICKLEEYVLKLNTHFKRNMSRRNMWLKLGKN